MIMHVNMASVEVQYLIIMLTVKEPIHVYIYKAMFLCF